MKAFVTRIPLGILALGTLLYMACAPTGNVNQNQNTTANANKAVLELKTCKVQTNPGQHAADLAKRLTDAIALSDLADNLKPEPTASPGVFTVEVQKATGPTDEYFEAYIKGEVQGDDNLKILSDILNNYQSESDCLRVVYFTGDLNAAPSPTGKFKWSSCEYPLQVCPGGECCPRTKPTETPGLTPTPTPNPLSNSGSNPNVNPKANTNK